ncbi:substrate-binding periplasmic protein [Duganella qianjiadongensis]|uniref:Transporter substrate-binding domain-containing protein n=1 Tax=Duganella qianjiadongensis TaxID=2692176 RepID=A0ABW9VQE3_9BURK|nr:transporter substrate-binding domain-containing protein [Duganella qianjiadongensis]MYM41160.1 transporter substrate-binding domain-containing protein [Duganella qianjiadongensis]
MMSFYLFRRHLLILCTCLLCSHGPAHADDIWIPQSNDREPWAPYVIELLQAALARAPAATPDHLHRLETHMTQDRAFTLLRGSQKLDIYWSMTSQAREQGVIVIRIPLLKGLLGQRLLAIRPESASRFAQIRTLDDLRRDFSLGQGHDWPDTAIQKAAGLNTVTSSTYDTLYQMLQARRFDAIPLGINEIDDELNKHGDVSMVVEKTLALVYPAPVFFFVAPKKAQLAARLEIGLNRMLADGSFDAMFDKRWSKTLLSKNMKSRRIFQLTNPLLSPETTEMIWRHPEYFLFPPRVESATPHPSGGRQ